MRTFAAVPFAPLLALLACAACADGSEPSPVDGPGGAAAAGGSALEGGAPLEGGASPEGGGGGGPGGGPTTLFPDPEWAEGTPQDHGFDPAALETAALLAGSEDSYCMIVIRHGTIVSEHYWNGRTATTVDESWSIAKSYSSALVGIAIERGDIESLDQSVADFVPQWQGSERSEITIEHLISMTSGLEWDAWQDYVAMATFAQDHSEFATELAADVPPGTEWTYHNGGMQMLEPVFRAATGMTMEQYAQQHLWSKIGSTAQWGHDPAGNPTAYANVLASCRDHARLGYLYMNAGRWQEQQVLPAAFVAASLTPSQPMNRAYGYAWWLNAEEPAQDAMMEPWDGRMVPFAPQDLFAARGFGNQFVDVIPSLDLMVVRMGADPAGSFDIGAMATDQRFEKHDAILAAVLDALIE